ncbi:MAG: FAD binding domain-containing protein [Candidatus Binataceae bacterium]
MYACPHTLEEAMRMLAEESGAKILAGGQSLMPMLNLRVAAPAALVDINRLAELSSIAIERGEISIGALTRHRTIETAPEILAALPILARAASQIGHVAIRNRGTIGGSLVHADPAAEWPLLAILLGAKLVARSIRGARTIAARDFFPGPLTSALEPDEILTEIRVPIAPSTTRFGFAEICRRRGDFAIVAVACAIEFDSRGRCVRADIGIGGANPTPVIAAAAGAALKSASDANRAISAAAEIAAAAADPSPDIHASAEFRRHLVRVITERALWQCFAPVRVEEALDV